MHFNKISQYIFYMAIITLLFGCASRNQKVDIYYRQQNWEMAKEVLDAEKNKSPEQYLQLAEVNGHLRLIPDMNKALAHVRSISPKYLEDADYIADYFWIEYFKAGEKNFENKMYLEAAKDFGLVVQIDSTKIDGFKRFGDALYLAENYDGAAEAYAAALKLSPDNLIIKNNLSEIYFIQGKYAETVALCDEILGVHNNDIEAVMRRAYANDALGNFKKAEDDYYLAVSRRPSAQLLSDFGQLYMRHGYYDSAIEHFEEALKHGGTPLLFHFLGEANWRIRDYRQMSRWYRRIVENNPGDIAAWKNLAVALEVLGYEDDLAAARYHITKLSGTN